AEASRLSEEERARREAQRQRERAKQRERVKYIPEAFDFTLAGETTLGSRGVYEIEATPRAGYKGKYANLLKNLRGKMWIDKTDFHWVRAEAEALDTVSFGLFLARIAKGARVSFELTRVNDEVWLPKHLSVEASGRLALLKKLTLAEEVT